MIVSFGDKETEKIWRRERSRLFPTEIQDRARMKLQRIDAAPSLEALRLFRSDKLHPLQGDKKGLWAIWINSQWRIIFRWTKEKNAEIVEITDYH